MDGIHELIRLVNVLYHRKEDAIYFVWSKLYFEAANFGL